MVERGFCKADVASSNLVGGSEFYKLQMSLLSQKDRTMTITALEHYRDFLTSEIAFIEDSDLINDPNYPEYVTYRSELYELNTLLNWIRLEYFKHED